MNCIEYIENFLSAHADGELSAAEMRDAEQHLRECLGCHGRMENERAMKSLLRQHIEMRTMPAAMRMRLLEALDRAASEENRRSAGRLAGRKGLRALERPVPWIPLALAAAIAIVFVTNLRFAPRRSAPARDADFDLAIAAFNRFQPKFDPNVPADSPAALAAAYARAKMPEFIWNFADSGFKLAGGRLEKLADGRKVTYTFYRGAQNSILCARFRAGDAPPAAGQAEALDGHRFYRYRGYSVCYTRLPGGGFVCVLASRLPLGRMVQAVRIALR